MRDYLIDLFSLFISNNENNSKQNDLHDLHDPYDDQTIYSQHHHINMHNAPDSKNINQDFQSSQFTQNNLPLQERSSHLYPSQKNTLFNRIKQNIFQQSSQAIQNSDMYNFSFLQPPKYPNDQPQPSFTSFPNDYPPIPLFYDYKAQQDQINRYLNRQQNAGIIQEDECLKNGQDQCKNTSRLIRNKVLSRWIYDIVKSQKKITQEKITRKVLCKMNEFHGYQQKEIEKKTENQWRKRIKSVVNILLSAKIFENEDRSIIFPKLRSRYQNRIFQQKKRKSRFQRDVLQAQKLLAEKKDKLKTPTEKLQQLIQTKIEQQSGESNFAQNLTKNMMISTGNMNDCDLILQKVKIEQSQCEYILGQVKEQHIE